MTHSIDSNKFANNYLDLHERKKENRLYLTTMNKEGRIEEKTGLGKVGAMILHGILKKFDDLTGSNYVKNWENNRYKDLFNANSSYLLKPPPSTKIKATLIPPDHNKIDKVIEKWNYIQPPDSHELKGNFKKISEELKGIDKTKLEKILSPGHVIPTGDQERLEELELVEKCLKLAPLIREIVKTYAVPTDVEKITDPHVRQRAKEYNLARQNELKIMTHLLDERKVGAIPLVSDRYISVLTQPGDSYIQNKWKQGKGQIASDESDCVGRILALLNNLAILNNKEYGNYQLKEINDLLYKHKLPSADLESISQSPWGDGALNRKEKLEILLHCLEIKEPLNLCKSDFDQIKDVPDGIKQRLDVGKIELVDNAIKAYGEKPITSDQKDDYSLNREETALVDKINQRYVLSHKDDFPLDFAKLQLESLLHKSNITRKDLLTIAQKGLQNEKDLELALKFAEWPEIEKCLNEVKKWEKGGSQEIIDISVDVKKLEKAIEESKNYPEKFDIQRAQFNLNNPEPVKVENGIITPTKTQLQTAFKMTLDLFDKVPPITSDAQGAMMARITQMIMVGKDQLDKVPYPSDAACFTWKDSEKLKDEFEISDSKTPWNWELMFEATHQPDLSTDKPYDVVKRLVYQTMKDYMRQGNPSVEKRVYGITDPKELKAFLNDFSKNYYEHLKKNPQAMTSMQEFNQSFCKSIGLPEGRLTQEEFNSLLTHGIKEVGNKTLEKPYIEAFTNVKFTNKQLADIQAPTTKWVYDLAAPDPTKWEYDEVASEQFNEMLRIHVLKMIMMTHQGIQGGIDPFDIDPKFMSHRQMNRFLNLSDKTTHFKNWMIGPSNTAHKRITDLQANSYHIGLDQAWILAYFGDPAEVPPQGKKLVDLQEKQITVMRNTYMFDVPSLDDISLAPTETEKPHSKLTYFSDIRVSPFLYDFMNDFENEYGPLTQKEADISKEK